MSYPAPRLLLPRLCFWFTQFAALVLFLLVFGSPLVDNPDDQGEGWRRYVAVFARDAVMRRTAIASGLGLMVTAFVCFRSTPVGKANRLAKNPPPPFIAGA